MEILYEEKDNCFIGITWSKELNSWIMHADCKSWSHNSFKRYLKGLKIAKQKLRDRGITFVLGLCETKKERKFDIAFGAVPNGIAVESDGTLNYITKLEI